MTIANNFFNQLIGTWENKLDGVWIDESGWNLIAQPQRGENPTKEVNFRVDRMRETIEFERVPPAGSPIRNIGTTGKAGFWDALSYKVSIQTPAGEGIHQEMGHFLLRVMENGETEESFRGEIIRQATIPRANAMMTFGALMRGSLPDAVTSRRVRSFYNGRPRVNDSQTQTEIDLQFSQAQQQVDKFGGPQLDDPLLWLQEQLRDTVIGTDWVFTLTDDANPSQMASGQRVASPVSIGNLLSDFWIGRRDLDGVEQEILQYAQRVDLRFHDVDWPHIAVNTLIKQP